MVTPLPCPFCGSDEVAVREGTTFRWRIAECSSCGATSGETRAKTIGEPDREGDDARAIDEWNRRAANSGAASALDVLRSLRADICSLKLCEFNSMSDRSERLKLMNICLAKIDAVLVKRTEIANDE